MSADAERLKRAHDVPGKQVKEVTVPARGYCDLMLTQGQCFRVIDLEGVQVLDYASFSLADPFEEKLSVVWSNFSEQDLETHIGARPVHEQMQPDVHHPGGHGRRAFHGRRILLRGGEFQAIRCPWHPELRREPDECA